MYCGNNPLIMVDPDGEWAFLMPIITSGLIRAFSGNPSNFGKNFGIGAAFGALGVLSAGGISAFTSTSFLQGAGTAMTVLGAETGSGLLWDMARNNTGFGNIIDNQMGSVIGTAFNFIGPTILESELFLRFTKPPDHIQTFAAETQKEEEIIQELLVPQKGESSFEFKKGQIGRYAHEGNMANGSYFIVNTNDMNVSIVRFGKGNLHGAVAARKGLFMASERPPWQYISRDVCLQQGARSIRKAVGGAFLANQLFGNSVFTRLSSAVFSGGYGPAAGLQWMGTQYYNYQEKY